MGLSKSLGALIEAAPSSPFNEMMYTCRSICCVLTCPADVCRQRGMERDSLSTCSPLLEHKLISNVGRVTLCLLQPSVAGAAAILFFYVTGWTYGS